MEKKIKYIILDLDETLGTQTDSIDPEMLLVEYGLNSLVIPNEGGYFVIRPGLYEFFQMLKRCYYGRVYLWSAGRNDYVDNVTRALSDYYQFEFCCIHGYSSVDNICLKHEDLYVKNLREYCHVNIGCGLDEVIMVDDNQLLKRVYPGAVYQIKQFSRILSDKEGDQVFREKLKECSEDEELFELCELLARVC